jgi:hypothetical protein
MDEMDVKDYRKQYEAELAADAVTENNIGTSHPMVAAAGADPAIQQRLMDIQRALSAGPKLGDKIAELLATLRNEHESVLVRDAALQALRAATFLGEHFAPYRVEFLDTLRQIARPDAPPELRQDALEALASEKDPGAQDLLRRGLQDPKLALVPAAKALQLLAYDDHSGVAALALQTFHSTVDLATKEAALRVLATDAKSQDLFAKLLEDKSQPRSLRALSATGLHFLNPQKFSDIARKIVLDNSDFEDIRATSLGALASAPDHQALRHDSGFMEQVKQLEAAGPLANLRAAAGRFMAKP